MSDALFSHGIIFPRMVCKQAVSSPDFASLPEYLPAHLKYREKKSFCTVSHETEVGFIIKQGGRG